METKPQLKRSLSLTLVTLYGVGVTVGAGIYVLVGLTAAKAGMYAPMAFLLAGLLTAFTGLSYAELSTRMPYSAGEAAYVQAGFGSSRLALIVGLLVAASGIISASAIAIGAATYLQHFLPLPLPLMTAMVIVLLGFVAIWGIVESVMLAALFTLLEIAGLLFVIYAGTSSGADLLSFEGVIPPFKSDVWLGIYSASLLAFFAFVGFEDIANIAEEVKQPRRTMPMAIVLTLLISSVLYFFVVRAVVMTVPIGDLVSAKAPLSLMFEGDAQNLFHVIAIIATMNGILVQIIMASRIFYGLSRLNNLPAAFGTVNAYTRTPLVASLFTICIILSLALFFPISLLAETTSIVVLVVFVMVNLALILIKMRGAPAKTDYFKVPLLVPFIGFTSALGLVASSLF